MTAESSYVDFVWPFDI